jgi:hypothetical protein
VADPLPRFALTGRRRSAELVKHRAEIKIGMPCVLNMCSQALSRGLFRGSGPGENLIWSTTSEQLYKDG